MEIEELENDAMELGEPDIIVPDDDEEMDEELEMQLPQRAPRRLVDYSSSSEEEVGLR
jgi:hypothetical protein